MTTTRACPTRRSRASGRPRAWHYLGVGSLCGLAWAAGLRGFMAQVAGTGSDIEWAGKLGWILASGRDRRLARPRRMAASDRRTPGLARARLQPLGVRSAVPQRPSAPRRLLRDRPVAIELQGLTKSFGDLRAVDGVSAVALPGEVTALLGPNGAGKTTSLRMLLGLVAPTSGSATFGGRRYDELTDPVRRVGAVLEASGYHPGRTALDHLRILATASRLPPDAPMRVLARPGSRRTLAKRVGEFSLGMRQRLGLAAAMLGDPAVLVLDEPTNGLDPPGVRWLRGYVRRLADEGRTVLVSSHALSEVEQTADHVLVLAAGRLLRSSRLADAARRGGRRLASPHAGPDRLCAAARRGRPLLPAHRGGTGHRGATRGGRRARG